MVNTLVISSKGLLDPAAIFARLLVALEHVADECDDYDQHCLLAEACWERWDTTNDPDDLQECADWLKEIGR